MEVDKAKHIVKHTPDIIGISSFTETFEEVIQESKYIKNLDPNVPIIVGGEHISALPESLPESIDIGVRGEGEETLTELMALYLKNEATPENLAKINGIVFRHNGELVVTPPRSWIMDLDSIPPPNREILTRSDEVWQQSIFTARGCPYKCTFCSATKFWERTRYHSVERVIQEIKYIAEHFPHLPLISINDDLFPLNKKRLREMVKAIREHKLHHKVGFTCNARASVFNEEVAQLLASMNTQVVCFGFESASDRILKLLKGKAKAAENQKALDLCEKYGFAVVGNFMVGSTDEKLEDMHKTYWFVRQNAHKIWRPNICFATPYPGTEFWTEAIERKLVDENFKKWGVLDLGFKAGESVYMNKHIPPEEFPEIYDKFLAHNAATDALKSQFYQMVIRRRYIEDAYKKIVEAYPQKVKLALEIGSESVNLEHFLDEPGIEKVRVYDGKLNFESVKDKKFPLIIISHALEKVVDPEKLLLQAHDYLEPDGVLVCLTYNAFHISFLVELLLGRWEPANFGIYQNYHLRFFTIPSLVKLVQKLPYKVTSVDKLKIEENVYDPFRQELLPLLENTLDTVKLKKSIDAFSSILIAQKLDINSSLEDENRRYTLSSSGYST